MTIKRIWHGWTTLENAGAYQNALSNEIFPSIEAKNIPGYKSMELFRRNHDHEVEFITVMTFDSIQNVINFQGEDYTRCYVPDIAQKILTRWDEHASHYEAVESRHYDLS